MDFTRRMEIALIIAGVLCSINLFGYPLPEKSFEESILNPSKNPQLLQLLLLEKKKLYIFFPKYEIFNLNKGLLKTGEPPAEALFPSGVPVDTSLSNLKTKEILGLGKTGIRDLLGAFKVEWESGKVAPITKRVG